MSVTLSLPVYNNPVQKEYRSSTELKLFAGLSTALLAFLYCAPLLHLADPAAAAIDLGVLSFLPLALLAILIFVSISLWLLGLIWPAFRYYRNHHFESNFKSLAPWQKITFYMIAFFLLLYAFVCCLGAVC